VKTSLSDTRERVVGAVRAKGAPAWESRTGDWLVSPRISLEKKFLDPLTTWSQNDILRLTGV